MVKRQLILVAVDQQSDVARAISVALETASAHEADVHVIHVVARSAVHFDDRVGPSTVGPHQDPVVNIGGLRAAMQLADDDSVRVRSVMLRGTPENVIPAYAQLHQATSLVLERDYGSSRFWRNGRLVDEMVRRSPIPVLVLPKRQTGDPEESGIRRIVTPVDFSIASAVALRAAVELSGRRGARIALLHTMKDVPRRMVFGGSEAWQVIRQLPAQKEAVAERLRLKAAFFGADDVDIEVSTGVADSAIHAIATRRDTDLIVMGIAHRSRLDRLLFGSTLRRVLRRATVPVLVVPVVAGRQTWPDQPAIEQIGGPQWTESGADPATA